MKITLALVAFAVSLTAAAKDRDWKPGKVMASRIVNTGARIRPTSGIAGSPGQLGTTVRTTTAAELEIFGGDYAYTVRDLGSGGLFKRPCRYIVGDPVKYAQDKAILFLVDADGKECKAEVMVQERLPEDLKPSPSPPLPPK